MREVPPPVRDARTVLGLVARFEGPEIGRDGKDARGLLEEVRLGSGRPSLLLRAWRADKLIPRNPGSYTTPENLPSKYSCAACGDGVPTASKRLSIKSLPSVLCIQFKVRPAATHRPLLLV